MKTLGHLERYQVTMEVISPLFIGSGDQVSKKEYLYDQKEGKVLMLNQQKLVGYLEKKKLWDKFQDFMLDQNCRNLFNFFRDQGIGRGEYKYFTDYTIDGAGEAIQRDNLREVKLFTKNAQGEPYIPGSSLKGALRTAILTKILLDDQERDQKALAQGWMKTLKNCPIGKDIKYKMVPETTAWESGLINTLPFNEKRTNDAVNSLMRGIAVSDSSPFRKNQLMLSQKNDRSVAGKDQFLPISRECLRPGSQCRLTITIDSHMAKETGWTMAAVQEAIRTHLKWQQGVFHKHFKGHEAYQTPPDQLYLGLGGGVGFANKTINQAALGEGQALAFNADVLTKLFPKDGHHDKDLEIGVSPHMQKMAKYQGQIYLMGLCRLKVE